MKNCKTGGDITVFLTGWLTTIALKIKVVNGSFADRRRRQTFCGCLTCWPQRVGGEEPCETNARITSSHHRTRSQEESQNSGSFSKYPCIPTFAHGTWLPLRRTAVPFPRSRCGLLSPVCPSRPPSLCFTWMVCRHLNVKCYLWSIKQIPGFWRHPKPVGA